MPKLYCPRCMREADMRLALSDCESLTCPECDETVMVPDMEALIDGWTARLPWLRQCAKIAPTA